MVIRRLGAADVEAYRTLRLAVLEHDPAAFTSSAREERARPHGWWADRVASLGAPPGALLGASAAEDDGILVCVVGLVVSTRRHARHKGTLVGMAVDPGCRGRGVGRELVEALLDEAVGQEVTQVVLGVTDENVAAERLYRSCGFTAWGLEPRALVVGGRPLSMRHMALALDGRARAPGDADHGP